MSLGDNHSLRYRIATSDRDWLTPSALGGRESPSFQQCAILYAQAGGETRYLSYLCEYFDDRSIASIDQEAIELAAVTLYPSAAPSTRNRRVHTVVSAVQKFAATHGFCHYRRIRRPRCVRLPSPLPTDEQLYAFINAASPHLKRIAVFLLYSGESVRATLRLDWSQIDLVRKVVRFHSGRGAKTRDIAIHPRIFDLLTKIATRDGKVFRRPDGDAYAVSDGTGGQLKSAFRGACKRAGVAGITPRVLHRVWISRQQLASYEDTKSDVA